MADALNSPAALIAFGILVGVFSGVMGLGGGSVMIPVMVMAFGLTQAQAHGTSLAVMIPPVTLPAVIEYYRRGNVNLPMAGWMAVGVLCGSFFGAYLANQLPKDALRMVFGFVLIYVASYTVFKSADVVRTAALAGVVLVLGAGVFFAADHLWKVSPPAGETPAAREAR